MNTIDAAKAALGTLTPLKTNCGRLCGGACCQSDETGENGMLLLPGEEQLYQQPIEGMPYHLSGDDTLFEGGKRFVCEGRCVRDMRPIACRLFPLRVRIEGESVRAEIDPRAWACCPILEMGGMRAMSGDFIRAVEEAGRALIQNDQIREAMLNEQRLLDEMRQL